MSTIGLCRRLCCCWLPSWVSSSPVSSPQLNRYCRASQLSNLASTALLLLLLAVASFSAVRSSRSNTNGCRFIVYHKVPPWLTKRMDVSSRSINQHNPWYPRLAASSNFSMCDGVHESSSSDRKSSKSQAGNFSWSSVLERRLAHNKSPLTSRKASKTTRLGVVVVVVAAAAVGGGG